MRFFIAIGADVNQADNSGVTPLIRAVRDKNNEALEALIKAGANVNKADFCGETPLYCAVQEGHLDIVEALIEAGADITQDNLSRFIEREWKDIIKLALINNGALLSECRDETSQYGKEGLIKEVIEELDESTLIEAIYNKNNEAFKALIEAGANPNQASDDDRTLLYWSVYYSNNEALNALIEAGANVNKADSWGETPLHVAADCNKKEASKALIAAGADVSIFDRNDKTPLSYFINKGWKDIIKLALIHNEGLLSECRDETSQYGKEGLIKEVIEELDESSEAAGSLNKITRNNEEDGEIVNFSSSHSSGTEGHRIKIQKPSPS